MKVFLTGANGFLGQYIKSFFKTLNHTVTTIGRGIENDIIADLKQENLIFDTAYDIVIHAAGKAHFIPSTIKDGQDFFDVNVAGTANLLKALEKSGCPGAFVFISSVAVYGLDEGILISEKHPLLANDPYGKSKIEAELLIEKWCQKNNVKCTILRLPLIAGYNPPGNLQAMIRGIKKGYYFNIAGGKAKKSIVLAQDVAKIIPVAAEIGGIYNLTDGYSPSFLELSKLIAIQCGKSEPLNIPIWMAKSMAKIGDILPTTAPINSNKLRKITSELTFDDSKARQLLSWKPTPVLDGLNLTLGMVK